MKKDRKFRISYETITPESAEMGCSDDGGWIDEDGESMEPDQFDIEEGLTPIDLSVNFLTNNTGADGLEFSQYPVKRGDNLLYCCWTAYKFNEDYRTGEIENRSFHPLGFTNAEIYEIHERLIASRVHDSEFNHLK